MATSIQTIESLGKALALVPELLFQPTMGDYSVYSRGRLFALVVNDELYIKYTPETLGLFRRKATRVFPGSIAACKADPEWLQDPEKLGEVVLYTLASHPPPVAPAAARCPGPSQGVRYTRASLKIALGLCAALAALYLILPYGALRAIGIHKGEKAQNFAVTGLNGEDMRLSDCGERPVFLYVWESNSQRAIDNLPMIGSLYAAYKDRQVCFMPVTITADFNLAVRTFAATMGLDYPVYNGAGRIAGQFLRRQSPMLYLIDHEGYIRRSYSPSRDDLDEISSDLENLLRGVPGRSPAQAEAGV